MQSNCLVILSVLSNDCRLTLIIPVWNCLLFNIEATTPQQHHQHNRFLTRSLTFYKFLGKLSPNLACKSLSAYSFSLISGVPLSFTKLLLIIKSSVIYNIFHAYDCLHRLDVGLECLKSLLQLTTLTTSLSHSSPLSVLSQWAYDF